MRELFFTSSLDAKTLSRGTAYRGVLFRSNITQTEVSTHYDIIVSSGGCIQYYKSSSFVKDAIRRNVHFQRHLLFW